MPDAITLGRKLNLVETSLNSNNHQPYGERFGDVLKVVNILGDSAYVEMTHDPLALSVYSKNSPPQLVTDLSVEEIVALIKRLIPL